MKTVHKNLNKMKLILLAVVIGIPLFLSGCINDNRAPVGGEAVTAATTTAKPTTTSKGTSTATKGLSFELVNATVAAPAGATGASTGTTNAAPTATLFFNAVSQSTLNDVCQASSNGSSSNPGKACKCRFSWPENNLSDASVITRTVETNLSQVTSFQVQCPVPDVYTNEIPDNTVIKISVVPDINAGNSSNFTTNVLNYTKQPTGSTGDFRDSEGRSFKNIFHYVCFDKFQQNLSINHTVKVATQNANGQNISSAVANSFTLGQGGQPTSFSAQSYFYDFYVRSNETGSINSTTSTFTCPSVNVNGVPSFFPMDSTFAVALNSSKDFSVVVQSRIVVTGASNTQGQNNILGFAAKPNSDGTCPAFTDSTGRIRRTFRLRQFTAVYPLRYDATGDVIDQSQPFNVIYVLDRPVDKVGQDPLKPITRLGPKPCPFSFKTAQFGQKCSTDASLAGWNVNGTQINGDPNCPVYPPVKEKWLKADGTLVIRPFKPFLPNYIENTNFKACTFQSSTPVDPEIVLSHDDTIYPNPPGPADFYCAKHYPAPGAIIPPALGDPFDKAPGECDLTSNATSIKTNLGYSCAKTYDPTNNPRVTPAAGCCQICSGSNCVAQGGGNTPPGRNAAFSPPQNSGNPAQAVKQLPRTVPNQSGGSGCFDPSED